MEWLIVALIVAVLIGFYVFHDWRKGVGYFAPYGPMSSSAQRAPIDEGRQLCSQGLSQLRAARSDPWGASVATSDAIATLNRSAALGNARAKTGLGIAAYFSGDPAAAHAFWLDARLEDDTARLLLHVVDLEEAKTFEDVTRAFLDSESNPNPYTQRTATEKLAEHASVAGLVHLAAELKRRATPNSYQG